MVNAPRHDADLRGFAFAGRVEDRAVSPVIAADATVIPKVLPAETAIRLMELDLRR